MIRVVLKEILHELREIRKDLQAIRSSMEAASEVVLDKRAISQVVRKSIRDIVRANGHSS